MPGGYGTEDTPWGTSGDTAHPGPVRSPVSTPSGGGGPPSVLNPPIPAPTPTQHFGELTRTGLGFEDPLYNPQLGKDVTIGGDTGAYTTGVYRDPYKGTITKTVTPQDTISKMLQLMETQADVRGLGYSPEEQTALAKNWKGQTTQNLFQTQGGFQIDPDTGKKVFKGPKKVVFTTPRVDESGRIGGEPVLTTAGKALHDYIERMGDEYDLSTALQDAPEIIRNATFQPQEGGGWEPRERYISQRERNARLLQFLNAGLPIKPLEQSGFHHQGMEDPYSKDVARAGKEGIFKNVISGGAFTPHAMRRLIKTFGSGYSSPRYANVARGGIMSVWNDRR